VNTFGIINEQVPAFPVAEIAEWMTMFAVSAMIVYANHVSPVQGCGCEPSVAAGVFTETVQYLDYTDYFGWRLVDVDINRVT
jgi:hypothetical protein